ncbi:MAG: methylmalonyl Co-A mutase-associated GTPase MeaB [Pseudomonadota bacterium]
MRPFDPALAAATLAARLRRGERRALSQAITLAESQRDDHRAATEALLERVAPVTGGALRIGLTGAPGVGKSSFIERFGGMLTAKGRKVAVLAVDPSSARTGGSILGDKTRMERLARDPNAYIRPSPAGAALGGVARRTREAILLAEAAGFDAVLVETVGVGQSETMVADMTDLFVLLLAPAGGDELQGVKRGVMELADLILVNKADGDLTAQAQATTSDYAGALRLLRKRPGDPEACPSAMAVSAATGAGLEAAWERMQAIDAWRAEEGWREARRRAQSAKWLRYALERGLLEAFDRDTAAAAAFAEAAAAVEAGAVTAEVAAARAVAAFLNRRG